MAIPAPTKYFVFSIFFILASVNFTRTALQIVENSKRLDELSQEVSGLEKEKEELTEAVAYKKTDEYIEEKARNDLSLIKPGEKVYVIPKELKDVNLEATVLGQSTSIDFSEIDRDKSHVKQWVQLFTQPF